MSPSVRILQYRQFAEMLAVQPCSEHARLLLGACEEDANRLENPEWSGYSETDKAAERIIIQILGFHRPSLEDHPETWVRKASTSLKLIRDYLERRTDR
jgi:hypothetical protein